MRKGQRYWLQQGNGHGGQVIWSGQREEGGESGKGGGILYTSGPVTGVREELCGRQEEVGGW